VARASLVNGWTLPYTSDWGDVWTLQLGLQSDGYWTVGNDPNDPNEFDTANEDSDFAGRLFPRASLQWRYPWSIQSAGWEQIVQPIAQVVAAPNGEWFNRGEIPNEDSLDFQFDDTTLFAANRFPGVDRVDPGARIDYGIQWGVYTDGGSYSELFIGQSFRLQETDVFPAATGLGKEGTSDIVGRALFQPIDELYGAYRFRYDEESLEASLHEVTASAGTSMFRVSGEYTFVAGDGLDFDDRETATLRAASRISENWFASGEVTRDLIGDLTQSAALNVTYRDECFLLSVTAERRNFEDRDLEPDDRIFVTVGLAQLGQFGTAFSNVGFGGGDEAQ
jgi:LPS-assembly protein